MSRVIMLAERRAERRERAPGRRAPVPTLHFDLSCPFYVPRPGARRGKGRRVPVRVYAPSAPTPGPARARRLETRQTPA